MNETDCSRFRPLTTDQMPHKIRLQYVAETPNILAIRGWVILQLEGQTGLVFNPDDWTIEQANLVQKWLGFQIERGDFSYRKYLRLETLLHGTLSSKIWNLGQRRCPVCSNSMSLDKQFPISILPIRIAPKSRQSLARIDWQAFQTAIRTRFAADREDLLQTNHLCLAFTFALNNLRNDRDLDNMAKAFQDAFSRALGFDDRRVHHLDIAKIIGNLREEYVIVRMAPSYLNDHSDIIIDGPEPNWAGQPALRLEDFQV